MRPSAAVHLQVAVGVQPSTCQVWDVARPGSAHILLGQDKQMDATALTDALSGQ